MIEIYTDGSAHPNPGPGGYAVVVYEDSELIETYYNYYDYTTNNEMELKAILYALITYGKHEDIVIVYTDSAYAINCVTNWAYSWEKNGWKRSNNQVPENLLIIQAYLTLIRNGYDISLRKVPGHCGVEGNELADKLAKGIIDI